LIEPERTNILAYSEDVPNWASLSIGIKTPLGDYDNLVDEPRYSPSTVGDKIVEDGSTGEHYIRSATWTSSDDTIQSCSVFLKAQVGVRLKNGSSYPYTRVNLSTGAIEASINTAAAVEEYSNGWYRVLISQDVGSGASDPYLYIYIGTGPSTFSYAGDNSSGIYVFGTQVEPDSLFPSSYIPTTTSSATREGDDLSVAINSTPRPMTVYAKWKDIGQNDQVETGGAYSAASVGPAPVEGDIMEARGYVRYDGKVRVGLSTNGGSESLSALGSPNEVAFTSAWGSDPYLRVGYGNTGVCGHGQFLLLSFKAVHGVQSMDYMRQLES
jgi:hypothetical protein